MIFQTLEWYANEKGYSVMHMPSCLTCCTVGGALAHNGIGILSTKYGKIDDQCLSVEVVLPNGDIINTLPVPKHSSGPNLLSLFLGSEGTLGIMTKARFKMVKLPEVRRHHAFLFDSISTGYSACREIVQTVKPSVMRLFDEAETVSIIKKVIGFEKKGAFMSLTVEGIARIVDVEEVTDFKKFVATPFDGRKFIAHCEEGEKPLLKHTYQLGENALILIGPEGDFSPEEIKLAQENGFEPISLGESRLRTETAALVACHTIHVLNQ